MRLIGASALITGGASGLGLATARRLSAAGAHATIADLPSSAGGAIAEELAGSFVATDVTDPEQVRSAVETARTRGPLRAAVSCAGIAPPGKILDRDGRANPLDDFARIIAVNLIGAYNVTALAAEAIGDTDPLENGARGVIVNTASVAAFEGQIGQAAYAASKGGVHSLTLPAARELARHGVRVCTIAPGVIETPLMRGLSEAAQESLAAQVPFPPRLGDPDEFAALVQHIVENDYLNGETIRLDGAIRMTPR